MKITDMSKTKSGYVLINDRKHFVYDGVNIIGRNKGAAVIIQDTSVSHYHSTIVIIGDRHYLSDLNSSNGTCLDKLTLTPFKLYELGIGSSLKFGLVAARYFKFATANENANLTSDADVSIEYDESVLAAGTQIYDIPKGSSQNLDRLINQQQNPSTSLGKNETVSENSVFLSINDMPTQLLDVNDDHEQLVNTTERKQRLCDAEEENTSKHVLINDLPTQILDTANDSTDGSFAENLNAPESIPHIIEETLDNIIDEGDENSRESTDFLTMQPATQHFATEPASQLFVQQLVRRVRNIIASSDDDSDNVKCQGGLPLNKDANDITSSDEETDIETMQPRKKKLSKKAKPIISSDSDGDSTDAEELKVSNLKEKSITNANDNDSDTDVEALPPGGINANLEANHEDMNDSDIIPTTQQDVKLSNHTIMSNQETSQNQEDKEENNIFVKDNSREISLTDSFQLMLTNTGHPDEHANTQNDKICNEEQPAVNQEVSKERNILPDLPIGSQINTTDTVIAENKETYETEQPCTQLEVNFDDHSVQVETDIVRPPNPLLNILDHSANLEKDSIEDELARMFQTQTPTEEPPKEHDALFDQPTQIVEIAESHNLQQKDEHLFLVPNQRIVLKQNKTKSIGLCADKTSKRESNESVNIIDEDDDIFAKSTQSFSTTDEKIDTSCRELDNDIFLVPTQVLMDNASTSKDSVTSKSEEKECIEDDIFLQPTQIVSIENAVNSTNMERNDATNEKHKGTTNKVGDMKAQEEDMFLLPTQILGICSDISRNAENVINSEKMEKDDASNKEDKHATTINIGDIKTMEKQEEDVFLLPTQVVHIISDNTSKNTENAINLNQMESNDASNNKAKHTTTNLGDVNFMEQQEEDVFLLPTQIVDINVNSDNIPNSCVSLNQLQNDVDVNQQKSRVIINEVEFEDKVKVFYKEIGRNIAESDSDDTDVEDSATTDVTTNIDASTSDKESAHSTAIKTVEIPPKSKQELATNEKKDYSDAKGDVEADSDNTYINIPPAIAAKDDTVASDKDSLIINGHTESDNTVTKEETYKEVTENRKSKRQIGKQNEAMKRRKIQNGGENNTVETRSKRAIRTPPITESKPLRRSGRQRSTDSTESEQAASNSVDSFDIKLSVIKEISTDVANDDIPTDQRETENSEDEFVDCAQQTPCKTRGRGKQISSVKASTAQATASNSKQGDRSRMKRKSPIEADDGSSKESLQFANANRDCATPTKQRKVEKRAPRKISTADANFETTDEEENEIPENRETHDKKTDKNIKSGESENDVIDVLAKPSASKSTTSSIDNKVKRTRRTNKEMQPAEDETSMDNDSLTKPQVTKLQTKKRSTEDVPSAKLVYKTNRTRKSKKTDKEIKHDTMESESSSDSTVNASIASTSAKAKSSESIRKNKANSSDSNHVLVQDINSQTRKSRRCSSVTTSEDDFQQNSQKELKPSTPVPNTPNRNKRILKPKVVFTMLDSPELETIIRSLGGFVVDSIEASTVLLTTNVKRSQKLLSAVGQSKPICSPKWLHDSKRANKFLDPWAYILEDEEAETKWNFSLKDSLKRSAEHKLLQDYTFLILTNAAQDVLKGAIESCGGKCVSRAPSKDNKSNFVVVASSETKSKYAKFLKQKPPPTIVAAEAIFDGVLRQQLRFEQHLLT